MTLDTKVLRILEDIAKDVTLGWNVKDGKALEYISGIPTAHSQPYLNAAYIHYYFAVKKKIKEQPARFDRR